MLVRDLDFTQNGIITEATVEELFYVRCDEIKPRHRKRDQRCKKARVRFLGSQGEIIRGMLSKRFVATAIEIGDRVTVKYAPNYQAIIRLPETGGRWVRISILLLFCTLFSFFLLRELFMVYFFRKV